MDKLRDIAGLVTNVCKFYRQDATEFTIDVWVNAMQPFDYGQVSRAFSAHLANPENGQYMPKPADIVKVLQGTSTDRAALAWGKTLEAMGSVGAYQDVVFDDPAIHAAVEDLGGWPKLCRTETKDLSYAQHRFSESYKAYAGRGEFPYPRRLAGDRSPDSDYERRGLKLPQPALVGDREKAKAVFLGGNVAGKTAITFSTLAELAHKRLPNEATA